MKGLLKKDLYMIWAYSKFLLLASGIFLLMSLFAEDNLFFLLYPTMVVAILPLSLHSYDEKFRWNVYCDATPLTRKAQVTEKYLLSLLLSGGVLLLMVLLHGVRMLAQGQGTPFLELLGALLMVSLVAPALLMPFVFRFGPERGRLAYLLLVGLMVALTILITGKTLTVLPTASSGLGFLLGVLVFSLLLFFASWRLSIRWYEKREF